MSAYEVLASVYDRLTEDVSYEDWANYIETRFRAWGQPIHTVLDLACGTGSLSCELARRGYEVIGADASAEMLAVAAEKAREISEEPPIFLHQAAESLDLYGTVDACICCLDSINYVHPEALMACFQNVYLFLEPGGLFLFDIRPPCALRAMDGQVFFDEREDLYCIWQGSFEEKTACCRFEMDLFLREENGLWRRSGEEHVEYAHDFGRLIAALETVGFTDICQYGDRRNTPPDPEEDRIFFTARKGTQR